MNIKILTLNFSSKMPSVVPGLLIVEWLEYRSQVNTICWTAGHVVKILLLENFSLRWQQGGPPGVLSLLLQRQLDYLQITRKQNKTWHFVQVFSIHCK